MSGWRNNGGWNKSHGTVEKTPRIDSFDSAISEGGGALFVCADGVTRLINCDHYTDYGPTPEEDQEIVELWKGEWTQTLELSRKRNGFGGSQAFFLCPACGERARYLYLLGGLKVSEVKNDLPSIPGPCSRAVFLCRKCSRLNYRSQQETRSDCMYYYGKGMGLVEKHLELPPFRIDGFAFCRWMPDRPRYMHQTTYRQHLIRFLRYQKKHSDRQVADMLRILRIFK